MPQRVSPRRGCCFHLQGAPRTRPTIHRVVADGRASDSLADDVSRAGVAPFGTSITSKLMLPQFGQQAGRVGSIGVVASGESRKVFFGVRGLPPLWILEDATIQSGGKPPHSKDGRCLATSLDAAKFLTS